MAGLRGETAYVSLGKQSAKGTPAAQGKHAWPFAGGNVQPIRATDNLKETDSQRDVGVTFIQAHGVEGTPEVYVRDNSLAILVGAAQGTLVDSGLSPNFVHTATMASALPYLTGWRMIGDTLFETFQDVFIDSLVVKADAGNPLTAAFGLKGLKATRLAADPRPGWATPAVTLESGTVYNYNDATVTLGGGATSLISSFELTVNNNVAVQQTDDVIPYDIVPGSREVLVAFDMIFETLTEYNQFHYGGAAGTVPASTLYTTSLDFQFDKGVNNQVKFTFPVVAYEEFPVDPQVDGSPVVVSVRAQAQRPASGSILTSVVKNQLATGF